MQNSKELMKRAGIIPRLRLAVKRAGGGTMGTGPHKVKILEDKIIRGKDPEGKSKELIEFMRYLVEEDGEKKTYDTRLKSKETGELSYLVQHFAEVDEGEEVILEFKRTGVRGFIEVTRSKSNSVERADDEDEDEGPQLPD